MVRIVQLAHGLASQRTHRARLRRHIPRRRARLRHPRTRHIVGAQGDVRQRRSGHGAVPNVQPRRLRVHRGITVRSLRVHTGHARARQGEWRWDVRERRGHRHLRRLLPQPHGDVRRRERGRQGGEH